MSNPPFGRFPLNNTTPFTFRDSYTFLELLNEFLEGKNQELVQHMAESFVDDEAQSMALAEISTKLSALTNQVAEIRKAVR